MGIRSIKLGPKSRHAEAPKEDFIEAVVSATHGTGCACGKYLLKSPVEVYEVRGTVHRANLSCYVTGGSKQAGPPIHPQATLHDLELRMKAVEKCLVDLIAAKRRPDPQCVCGCHFTEHEAHINEDWEQEARGCLSCPCTRFEKAGAR